jgi:hypothetical protein
MNKGPKELIKYVRNKKGMRVGVVLAVGATAIGWSKCSKRDKWDREKGLLIARRRATGGFSSKVPNSVEKDFDWMAFWAGNHFGVAETGCVEA